MLEVWGRNNSFNVQKVLWCCEELEIPFQRYDAGGLYGGTNEDDYLARNPTGLVPTSRRRRSHPLGVEHDRALPFGKIRCR